MLNNKLRVLSKRLLSSNSSFSSAGIDVDYFNFQVLEGRVKFISSLIENPSISTHNKWLLIAQACSHVSQTSTLAQDYSMELYSSLLEHESELVALLLHFHHSSLVSNRVDMHQNTLLHLAVELCQVSNVFNILGKASVQGELKLLIFAQNNLGETSLHIAAKLLHHRLVNMLILAKRSQSKQLVAIQDLYKLNTPLMNALQSIELLPIEYQEASGNESPKRDNVSASVPLVKKYVPLLEHLIACNPSSALLKWRSLDGQD